MRRADARRNASVMINSSIRWSLAGNEVDWMMKTSEPRTFSWISTNISMSANRRTTALVSARPSPSAISCASAGLELPATSLIEPFLADIAPSPRALLDTMFSISSTYRTGGFRWARKYQAGDAAATRDTGFPGQKWPPDPANWLMGGVPQRADAKTAGSGLNLVRRSPPPGRGGLVPGQAPSRRLVRR